MHKKFLRTLFVSGLFVLGLANSQPSIAMIGDDELGSRVEAKVRACTTCKGTGQWWGITHYVDRLDQYGYKVFNRVGKIERDPVRGYMECPDCVRCLTGPEKKARDYYVWKTQRPWEYQQSMKTQIETLELEAKTLELEAKLKALQKK